MKFLHDVCADSRKMRAAHEKIPIHTHSMDKVVAQKMIRDKQLPYAGILGPTLQSGEETIATTEMRTVEVLPPTDVLDTLRDAPAVQAVILDPWYNKGVGGHREDYDEWLSDVIASACRIASHVFVWGFPEIVARQIPSLPETHGLVAWLTWYYKNCPSVIRGWRSAQNSCLHLASDDAEVYPEHFLTDDQLERLRAGKMRFIPGPPSVLEAPLNIGFVGKNEQTGHPAQKPLSVIEPLILMSTKKGDTVLDPMCGSGTTGEACLRLGRRAVLCDESAEWLDMTSKRLGLA